MRCVLLAIAVAMFLEANAACAQHATSAGHSDAGAIVFKKCMACHQVGDRAQNGIGPVLNGIEDRPAGTYPGYNYSAATKSSGLIWDDQTLARYLRAPRAVIPGTRMAFAGLSKDHEILDVIAYLKQFAEDGHSQ
jgi:cytochrome c